MGRVMSLINATADGFVDGQYALIDAEYYEFSHRLLAETETVAFGRNTFELFQNRWPAILENNDSSEWHKRMAQVLNDMQKAAYSSTMKTTTWHNSTIIRKIEMEHFDAYKRNDKGGLLTLGSPGLVAALAEMNLIDDYYFCIHPMIAGNGIHLFDNLKLRSPRALKYANSVSLKSGVQILHYESVS